MKALFYCLILLVMNINLSFLPKSELIIIMGIMMLLDLCTGVFKAVMLEEKRTSNGFRSTLSKFIQYGGAILISMSISFLGSNFEIENSTWKGISEYMSYMTSIIIIYTIFIEVVSCIENMIAVSPKSKFAKYMLAPALAVLTIEIKKGPFRKLTIETDDSTISQEILNEDITIKKTIK